MQLKNFFKIKDISIPIILALLVLLLSNFQSVLENFVHEWVNECVIVLDWNLIRTKKIKKMEAGYYLVDVKIIGDVPGTVNFLFDTKSQPNSSAGHRIFNITLKPVDRADSLRKSLLETMTCPGEMCSSEEPIKNDTSIAQLPTAMTAKVDFLNSSEPFKFITQLRRDSSSLGFSDESLSLKVEFVNGAKPICRVEKSNFFNLLLVLPIWLQLGIAVFFVAILGIWISRLKKFMEE